GTPPICCLKRAMIAPRPVSCTEATCAALTASSPSLSVFCVARSEAHATSVGVALGDSARFCNDAPDSQVNDGVSNRLSVCATRALRRSGSDAELEAGPESTLPLHDASDIASPETTTREPRRDRARMNHPCSK